MVDQNAYNCGFCVKTVQGWDNMFSTKSYDRPCDECIFPEILESLRGSPLFGIVKEVLEDGTTIVETTVTKIVDLVGEERLLELLEEMAARAKDGA